MGELAERIRAVLDDVVPEEPKQDASVVIFTEHMTVNINPRLPRRDPYPPDKDND